MDLQIGYAPRVALRLQAEQNKLTTAESAAIVDRVRPMRIRRAERSALTRLTTLDQAPGERVSWLLAKKPVEKMWAKYTDQDGWNAVRPRRSA